MKIREFVPLYQYTSYRIGGPARFFLEPESPEEIQEALAFAKSKGLPHYILGKGTNLLVSDGGVEGVVIYIGPHFSFLEVEEKEVRAGGALPLNTLIRSLAENNLGGFEALAGIPGSVAGAVVMNAGAHGVFLGDFVQGVDVVTKEGLARRLVPEDLEFGYRRSIFQRENHIIWQVHLQAQDKEQSEIEANIVEVLGKRTNHPQLPSCGSTFRNPPGIPAGKLVEEMGLKGTRSGDAQIAPQHGNFIVNLGRAKAQDVYTLICLVQTRAAQRGINLELEVRLWGQFKKPPGL